MRKLPITGFLWLLASALFAQQTLHAKLKLSDFYAHDPFILAHKQNKTYYLYTAASRGKRARIAGEL